MLKTVQTECMLETTKGIPPTWSNDKKVVQLNALEVAVHGRALQFYRINEIKLNKTSRAHQHSWLINMDASFS